MDPQTTQQAQATHLIRGLHRMATQEQVTQGVHRRSTPEAGAEDGIQALALQGHEGDDLLVRRRARKRGQYREQQQVAHAVALALGTARVGHLGKGGKQESEWHQAT